MLARLNRFKTSRQIIWLFLALAIVYIFLSLLIPPDEQSLSKYDLSLTEAQFLRLTILLPYTIIWAVALYGYLWLREYSNKIADAEGRIFKTISDGLLVLALWMPVSALVGLASSIIRRSNDNLFPETVIGINYINLLLVLVAFYLIYKGAKKLPAVLKKQDKDFWPSAFFWIIFISISSIFSYTTLANPARQHPTDNVARATYYLPDWLLIITIVIPYIMVFFFGLRAALYIVRFSANAPGKIYLSALRFLAAGILTAILSLMLLRLLSSSTAWFDGQGLKAILGIIYLLLLFIGVGFALIAKGAKKLLKIEEA